MFLTADDDLTLLAARLKLGLPLQGFDGRDIPLRRPSGECLAPIDAAEALLLSAASLLPCDEAETYIGTVADRAAAIEAAADAAGEAPAMVVARVTAVLVSGAVRASVLAKRTDACPSDLNRATLSWYERSELRRREVLDAARGSGSGRAFRLGQADARTVGTPISMGLPAGSALHSNQPPS